MSVGHTSGYPDYTFDGNNQNIPIVFSAKTLKRFYESTVLNEVSNTEYIGEIKSKGDKVIIRTVPDVTISDYVKGTALDLENPESPSIELTIDHAKYFNFALDDVDTQQMDINMISKWAENAAARFKIVIETAVWADIYADGDAYNQGNTAGYVSQNLLLGATGAPVALTPDNILEKIIDCGQCLDERNQNEQGRWMILPAWAIAMIKKSELKDASLTGDSQSILRNGRVGMIDTFTLYKSNILSTATDSSGPSCTRILYGTQDALAFAMTLTKTENYRPQNTFANAMKGLSVYGYKVVIDDAFGMLYAYKG